MEHFRIFLPPLVCARVVVVALSLAAAGVAPPVVSAMSLPALPTTFTCRVQANIVNKNYSISIHEWVDEPNNRGRVDTYRASNNVPGGSTSRNAETGYTSDLYLYDTDTYIHTNSSGCYGNSLESLGPRLPFGK